MNIRLLSEHLGLKSQDDVLRSLEDIELFFGQVFELRTASSHCRGLQLSGSLPFKLKMVMHSSSMIKLGMI